MHLVAILDLVRDVTALRLEVLKRSDSHIFFHVPCKARSTLLVM